MENKNITWDYLKEGFLNFIYPFTCENCGKLIRESRGYAICDGCMKNIDYISTPFCYQCGKPLSAIVDFEEKALCADCNANKKHIYFNRSIAYYRGTIRKCIHLLKYKKQLKLIKPLGEIMVNYLNKSNFYNIKKINLIIPVPLFEKDYLKRGFNQSALIAKYIADYFNISFSEELLIKKVENASQVGLSKTEREYNVKNVYSVNYSLAEKINSVLLIDDIYTTGATVEACSKELKKIGIKTIFVLTLTRGV